MFSHQVALSELPPLSFTPQVLGHRSDELRALAVRKYLDALCVYFWAATQLLLSGTTFGLMVLLGQPLRSVKLAASFTNS